MDALARANAKNPAVKRLLQARRGCVGLRLARRRAGTGKARKAPLPR